MQIQTAAALKNMHETIMETVHALENIGVTVDYWDPLTHHLMLKKLDATTHGAYEQHLENSRALQSFRTLLKFLEKKFQALELIGCRQEKAKNVPEKRALVGVEETVPKVDKCECCTKENHSLVKCFKFIKMDVSARHEKIKKLGLCYRCLKGGHMFRACKQICSQSR